MKTFADLHSHSSLKTYNANKNDLWKQDFPKDRHRDHSIFTASESEFSALAKAGTRVLFLTMYPVEQGFLDNLMNNIIKNDSEIADRINTFLHEFIDDHLFIRQVVSRYLMGMSFAKSDQITSDGHDYFADLQGEFEYLCTYHDKYSPVINGLDRKFKMKLVKDYHDLVDILGIDANYEISNEIDDTIAVILTVEGGHSLGCGSRKDKQGISIDDLYYIDQGELKKPRVEALYQQLKQNIETLKNWGPGDDKGAWCPFFITLSHHFWNQLCGHNMSFANAMNGAFSQEEGMNKNITELGKKVVKLLLDKSNGRRVLIDTKHMSMEGKKWYYGYLRQIRENGGEAIPIISSHSAVNGFQTMEEAFVGNEDHESGDEKYGHSTIFNNWDINLSGEEIMEIYYSGGLIGLNLDQRILSGKEMAEFTDKYTYKNSSPELFQSVWTEPLVRNVLHILEVVHQSGIENKSYAWEMIAIGSDFDGMINPLDAFCFAEDFESLREMLLKKLEQRAVVMPLLDFSDNQEEKPASLADFVDGIMYKNALRFLEKHYIR